MTSVMVACNKTGAGRCLVGDKPLSCRRQISVLSGASRRLAGTKPLSCRRQISVLSGASRCRGHNVDPTSLNRRRLKADRFKVLFFSKNMRAPVSAIAKSFAKR